MKIGDRLSLADPNSYTEENLRFLRQVGADGVMINIAPVLDFSGRDPGRTGDTVAERMQTGAVFKVADLVALREQAERHGLELFNLSILPFHRYDKILQGLPGRDEQIENWRISLRNMAEAGIPMLNYAWGNNIGAPEKAWRTGDVPVRGGAPAAAFDRSIMDNRSTLDFGELTEEAMWDNIAYFLRAVMPVANEVGVQMTLHPADPQVPVLGGIAQIMRSVEAYERILDLAPGPANTVNFCQGCFSQMLDVEGVYDAIRSFGRRGKIGYVHFRNVRGNVDNFVEQFPDDGQIDMARAMRVYREVGFEGYFTPDHLPRVEGDSAWGHRARAFAIGHMRGLIQSL